MELKDLEEMFKMEQELDIPYRDRWYNKDFDKRELEAIQEVNKCNLPPVSKSACLCDFSDRYWDKNGSKCLKCGKHFS